MHSIALYERLVEINVTHPVFRLFLTHYRKRCSDKHSCTCTVIIYWMESLEKALASRRGCPFSGIPVPLPSGSREILCQEAASLLGSTRAYPWPHWHWREGSENLGQSNAHVCLVLPCNYVTSPGPEYIFLYSNLRSIFLLLELSLLRLICKSPSNIKKNNFLPTSSFAFKVVNGLYLPYVVFIVL